MKKIGSIFLAIVLIFTMVKTGGVSVFALQSGDYTYTVSESSATITDYNGIGGDLTIPSTLGGYIVTGIGNSAFSNYSGLTSVTIPSSVTFINNSAFSGCNDLTQFIVNSDNANYTSQDGVLFNKTMTMLIQYPEAKSGSYIIPNSVVSINNDAFISCQNLSEVTIGSGITTLYIIPFFLCSALTQIEVDSNNQYFSSTDGVLFNKAKTNLIRFPDAKTGNYTIPNGVTTVGYGAFWGCSGLTSITIPLGVTGIGNSAFANCIGLTSISIPSSVTTIISGAFYHCDNLINFTVDANSQSFSSQDGVLFNKTKNILYSFPAGRTGEYSIPNGVTIIGEEAFSYSKLSDVTIPYGVTKISDEAFYFCRSIKNIAIPNSVTTIGNSAFAGSMLTSVTFPESLTSIGYLAFYGCSSLTAAYFLGNAPTMGINVFGLCASTFKVYYVPSKTGFTNPWNGYPAVEILAPPTGLTVTDITNTTASLSWAPVIGATGYDVYNGTEKLTATPIDTTTYTVTGLTAGTTYTFTVKAVNAVTESPFSTELSVTVAGSLPGDINGDDEVNLKDVTTLSRYVAGWTGLTFNPDALDVNADGEVDLIDITLLSRYVAGWEVEL